MKLLYLKWCLALLVIVTVSSICFGQNHSAKTQTFFGLEEKIKRPVKVSKDIQWQIIQHEGGISDADIVRFSSGLKGSQINLNDDGEPDFLVQGDDGANITGFWVFISKNGKKKLVLASRAAWLTIGTKRRKGMRNISIAAASATTLWTADYLFNGKRYFPTYCSEEPINEPKKKKRITCSDSDKPYR